MQTLASHKWLAWLMGAWTFSGAGAYGCVDDAAFVGLDKLCPTVAELVCDGKQRCCKGEQIDQEDCEALEQKVCDRQHAELTANSQLTYDGEQADRVLDDLDATLSACEPAFALARFFEGGHPAGASCTGDTQCKDGLCLAGEEGERKCGKPVPTPLCQADTP